MADAKSVTSASENLYMQLNASELSAIKMKGSPNSNDRDAGFCSGSSEGGDDLSLDHGRLDPTSPIDASEESIEVKVSDDLLVRNKRKSVEPSKVMLEREESPASTAPLKKRIRYTSTADSAVVLTPPAAATPQPTFWDPSQVLPHELMPNPAHVFKRHPGLTTLFRPPIDEFLEQTEPLALVVRKPTVVDEELPTTSKKALAALNSPTETFTPKKWRRVGEHSFKSATFEPTPEVIVSTPDVEPPAAISLKDESMSSVPGICLEKTSPSNSTSGQRPQQRNYKNMTRERRIEANARERTRVHTISAAYETLRKAVPSYASSQKLSKLSVLRVACSYILALSRMAGHDYSADQSAPSIASCFEAITATIQTEGKIKKKKDE